jgi:hypothetical protein
MRLSDLSEPLALIIVAVVTVGGSWLTNRAANRSSKSQADANLRGSIETARVAAEEGAYQRAKSFYEGVIDRQDREIAGLEQDAERLRGRVSDLEGQVGALTAELETAKNALRLKFPDE